MQTISQTAILQILGLSLALSPEHTKTILCKICLTVFLSVLFTDIYTHSKIPLCLTIALFLLQNKTSYMIKKFKLLSGEKKLLLFKNKMKVLIQKN